MNLKAQTLLTRKKSPGVLTRKHWDWRRPSSKMTGPKGYSKIVALWNENRTLLQYAGLFPLPLGLELCRQPLHKARRSIQFG